jgi:small subunit ribosomal protein S9
MTTKKIVKKEEQAGEEKKSEYFYAIGRRKTAIARVKIFESSATQNSFKINEKKLEEYFSLARLRDLIKAPIDLVGGEAKFDVVANVSGGGLSAQADAVKLGVARALVVFNADNKKILKAQKFLTRDSREVERKKPGLRKARRAPQWAKR